MSWLRRSATALVFLVPLATGCDKADRGPEEASGTDGMESGSEGEETEGEETEGEETDGEAAHFDLYSCGFELSCPQFYDHLGPEGDPVCAQTLAATDGVGVLSYVYGPGPNIDEVETLSILLGDGTALIQIRERHCGGPGTDPDCVLDFETLPWEPGSAHMICPLFRDAASEEACTDPESEECFFYPVDYANCETVDDFACEDAADILEGA